MPLITLTDIIGIVSIVIFLIVMFVLLFDATDGRNKMGPFCSDCGSALRALSNKYLKEDAIWYKCANCGAEWEYDYGGVVPYPNGPKIKRKGGMKQYESSGKASYYDRK